MRRPMTAEEWVATGQRLAEAHKEVSTCEANATWLADHLRVQYPEEKPSTENILRFGQAYTKTWRARQT